MRYSYAWRYSGSSFAGNPGPSMILHVAGLAFERGGYVLVSGPVCDDSFPGSFDVPGAPDKAIAVRNGDERVWPIWVVLERVPSTEMVVLKGRLFECPIVNEYEDGSTQDGTVRYVDATASRFHPASIAGLVVGAMGVFVFTVALRHWLGERRKFRE
jgi:hypothetical protein